MHWCRVATSACDLIHLSHMSQPDADSILCPLPQTSSCVGAVLMPIQPRHAGPMADIILRVSDEYGLSGEAGFAVGDPELTDLYNAYARAGHHYVIAEHGGYARGGGGFAPLRGGEEGTCEIRKMYLLAAVRGQGLGRRLLHHLLDAARAVGYRRAYLETTAVLVDACRLYEATGFERLEVPLGDTGHSGACECYYLKSLG